MKVNLRLMKICIGEVFIFGFFSIYFGHLELKIQIDLFEILLGSNTGISLSEL